MNFLYDLWDDFISLLFPRLCGGCGQELLRNERAICSGCIATIPRTGFHLEENNPVARLFWGRCRIEKASSFSYYTRGSRIRNIIHSLKYRSNTGAGTEIGMIYGEMLKSSGFLNDIDIIIPVPLHPDKQKKRGFNQSEIICEGISRITGIDTDSVSLIRVTQTDTQTRKSRYERWVNVEGIFRVSDPERLKGKHVLLVDDVITTGSTIESCAGELLNIDGCRVSVASLAFAIQ